MRRFGLFIAFVLSVLVLVTAVTQAQTNTPQPIPIPSDTKIDQMIDGRIEIPLTPVKGPSGPLTLGLLADEPADSCVDAPILVVLPDAPADGGAADVAQKTEDETDPILSCVWGEPEGSQGFRTVWYKLIAPIDGRIDFDTFNSTYDTILGVFTGQCGALTALSCNDDHNGFSSKSLVHVTAGTTYYIEVADRSLGIVDRANMQLSVLLEPVESRWSQTLSHPPAPAISRHATVVQGDNLYVIGGESVISTPILSNKLYRFNAWYNTWTELADIPGAGYANTTAARLGDQIYLPSGFSGAVDDYDGLHWRYDIPANNWSTVEPLRPWQLPGGRPFAWAAAAAHPNQTRYFLTGGINNAPLTPETTVLNNVFEYTKDTDSWTELVPMISPRYGHTAAWLGNGRGVCVAGGLSTPTVGGNPVLLPFAECYTPGGSWVDIGILNRPRFGAGSAVGPDGRWYIFGGIGIITIADENFLLPVAQTEVYDPFTNTWEVLPVSANLGNNSTAPARGWPRGEFIGNQLWVVGGSIYTNGEQALPLIEKMYVPSANAYLPFTIGNYDDWQIIDDTLSQARPIAFGIPQSRNFDQQRDFFDFFTFEITSPRHVQIKLEVPENNNFDLELYGAQKFLWRASRNSFNGQDEDISIDLTPRRYYILVKRMFPTGQPDKGGVYRISIN